MEVEGRPDRLASRVEPGANQMEAFEPLGRGRGIRVERGAWARRRWDWSCGACVTGEPELHDLIDFTLSNDNFFNMYI